MLLRSRARNYPASSRLVGVLAAVVLLVLGWAAYLIFAGSAGSGPFRFFTHLPPGYVADATASGSLNLTTAAEATVVAAPVARTQLRRDGCLTGSSRLWNDGDEYAQITIFSCGSSADAQRLERFELAYAGGLAGGGSLGARASRLTVPGVPAAAGFFADGDAVAGGQPLFIYGAWFTVGPRAYLVETGGMQPQPTVFLQILTSHEYALAKGRH